MGQISIVAMQNSSPKVTECFNVESRILCMAYVPVEQPEENGEKIPDNNSVPSTKAGDTPSICLGMEEGRYSMQLLIKLDFKALHSDLISCPV